MFKIYSELLDILQNRTAAIKLFLINYGIKTNGHNLASNIQNYPEHYKTKPEQDFFVPQELLLDFDGYQTIAKVNYNKNSIFELLAEKDTVFIYCKELDLKINCSPVKRGLLKNYLIDNIPADEFIQFVGIDRISVLGYEGCDGYLNRDKCKFCDPASIQKNRVRPNTLVLPKDSSNAELREQLFASAQQYFNNCKIAYQYIIQNKLSAPHLHLHLMAGNLSDIALEWEYMLLFAKELATVKPLNEVDSYLNLIPPPDLKYVYQAKETGFKNLIYNLEVYGEEDFISVCPGKHRLMPYKDYVAKLIESAQIFGSGNVRTSFVLGAQDINKTKEGVIALAQKGIVSDYTVFTAKKATPWADKKSPNILEVAEFSVFVANVNKQHGFKPLYCSLSSRSSIINELADL